MEASHLDTLSEGSLTEARDSSSIRVVELLHLDLGGESMENSMSNNGMQTPTYQLAVSSPCSVADTPWLGSENRSSIRQKKIQCVRFVQDMPNVNSNKEEAQLGDQDTSHQDEDEFVKTENEVREKFAREAIPACIQSPSMKALPEEGRDYPTKPIILNQLTDDVVERSLFELEMITQHGNRALDVMKRGCFVYKYKRGVATKRFQYLNEEDLSIEWRELTSKEHAQFNLLEDTIETDKPVDYSVKNSKFSLLTKATKNILLSDISGQRFGPYRVHAFRKFTELCNQGKAKPWYSMVIQSRYESLMLVFLSINDVVNWSMGQQQLSPNTMCPMTIGKQLWFRALLKLYHIKFYRFNALPGCDWTDMLNSAGVIDFS